MRVGIDESRKNSLSTQIDLFAQAGREAQHFVVGAHRENTTAADGHRLGAWQVVVHGPDVAVIKNQFGFDASNREQSKRAHTIHEVTPRHRPDKS